MYKINVISLTEVNSELKHINTIYVTISHCVVDILCLINESVLIITEPMIKLSICLKLISVSFADWLQACFVFVNTYVHFDHLLENVWQLYDNNRTLNQGIFFTPSYPLCVLT